MLEQQIAELNQNLGVLIGLLQGGAAIAPANGNGAQHSAPAPAASSPTPPATSTTTATAASADKPLTYDDIKNPFLELTKKKGREAGLAVCQALGVEKLPQVPQEKWAQALTEINTRLQA